MPQLTCPTCRAKFDSAASRALPFCSHRCRQIDLGRWLSEEQRVSMDPLGEVAEDPGESAKSDDDDP